MTRPSILVQMSWIWRSSRLRPRRRRQGWLCPRSSRCQTRSKGDCGRLRIFMRSVAPMSLRGGEFIRARRQILPIFAAEHHIERTPEASGSQAVLSLRRSRSPSVARARSGTDVNVEGRRQLMISSKMQWASCGSPRRQKGATVWSSLAGTATAKTTPLENSGGGRVDTDRHALLDRA